MVLCTATKKEWQKKEKELFEGFEDFEKKVITLTRIEELNKFEHSEIYIKNAERRANRALGIEHSNKPRWRANIADVGIRQKLI